jgi:hypothetical protein
LQAEYGQTVDRDSAYERLANKLNPPQTAPDTPAPQPPVDMGGASTEGSASSRGSVEPSMMEKVIDSPAFKSALRSAGTVIGREITRSIFGTGRRRRR